MYNKPRDATRMPITISQLLYDRFRLFPLIYLALYNIRYKEMVITIQKLLLIGERQIKIGESGLRLVFSLISYQFLLLLFDILHLRNHGNGNILK